ncbi:MAG TPA: hypothetical protein VJ904_13560, partial [Tichowtungia sp.]|nr:hypothetical protein [Tichowtungia sp.]
PKPCTTGRPKTSDSPPVCVICFNCHVDVMDPMAFPVCGGMVVEVIVPVLYCAIKERKMNHS